MRNGIKNRPIYELVDVLADYQACKLTAREIETKHNITSDALSRLRRVSECPLRKSVNIHSKKITLKSAPVPMSVLRKRIEAAIVGNKLSHKNQDVSTPTPQKMASLYHRPEPVPEPVPDSGRKLPEFPDIKDMWKDYRPIVRGRL